jgi:hypothetical protein
MKEFKALLQHADTNGEEPKGSKAEQVARVQTLESVKAALAVRDGATCPRSSTSHAEPLTPEAPEAPVALPEPNTSQQAPILVERGMHGSRRKIL